jgi:hypothetical protein
MRISTQRNRAEANDRTAQQQRRVGAIQQKMDKLDEAFLYSEATDVTSPPSPETEGVGLSFGSREEWSSLRTFDISMARQRRDEDESNGEPNVRELEPHQHVARTDRRLAKCRLATLSRLRANCWCVSAVPVRDGRETRHVHCQPIVHSFRFTPYGRPPSSAA